MAYDEGPPSLPELQDKGKCTDIRSCDQALTYYSKMHDKYYDLKSDNCPNYSGMIAFTRFCNKVTELYRLTRDRQNETSDIKSKFEAKIKEDTLATVKANAANNNIKKPSWVLMAEANKIAEKKIRNLEEGNDPYENLEEKNDKSRRAQRKEDRHNRREYYDEQKRNKKHDKLMAELKPNADEIYKRALAEEYGEEKKLSPQDQKKHDREQKKQQQLAHEAQRKTEKELAKQEKLESKKEQQAMKQEIARDDLLKKQNKKQGELEYKENKQLGKVDQEYDKDYKKFEAKLDKNKKLTTEEKENRLAAFEEQQAIIKGEEKEAEKNRIRAEYDKKEKALAEKQKSETEKLEAKQARQNKKSENSDSEGPGFLGKMWNKVTGKKEKPAPYKSLAEEGFVEGGGLNEALKANKDSKLVYDANTGIYSEKKSLQQESTNTPTAKINETEKNNPPSEKSGSASAIKYDAPSPVPPPDGYVKNNTPTESVIPDRFAPISAENRVYYQRKNFTGGMEDSNAKMKQLQVGYTDSNGKASSAEVYLNNKWEIEQLNVYNPDGTASGINPNSEEGKKIAKEVLAVNNERFANEHTTSQEQENAYAKRIKSSTDSLKSQTQETENEDTANAARAKKGPVDPCKGLKDHALKKCNRSKGHKEFERGSEMADDDENSNYGGKYGGASKVVTETLNSVVAQGTQMADAHVAQKVTRVSDQTLVEVQKLGSEAKTDDINAAKKKVFDQAAKEAKTVAGVTFGGAALQGMRAIQHFASVKKVQAAKMFANHEVSVLKAKVLAECKPGDPNADVENCKKMAADIEKKEKNIKLNSAGEMRAQSETALKTLIEAGQTSLKAKQMLMAAGQFSAEGARTTATPTNNPDLVWGGGPDYQPSEGGPAMGDPDAPSAIEDVTEQASTAGDAFGTPNYDGGNEFGPTDSFAPGAFVAGDANGPGGSGPGAGGLGAAGGTSAAKDDSQKENAGPGAKKESGGVYARGEGAGGPRRGGGSGGGGGVGMDMNFADLLAKLLPNSDEAKKEELAAADEGAADRMPASDGAAVLGRNANIFEAIHKRYIKKSNESAIVFQ